MKYYIVTALLCLGGGYILGYQNREVVTDTRIVHERGEKEIVYRDRIVTRTIVRKPDGTTTETETTEERDRTERERNDRSSSETVAASRSASRYRLGTSYWASSTSDVRELSRTNLELHGAVNLLGPLDLELGTRPLGDRKEVSLGLSIRF
jgi:hypothetical protein